MGSIVAAQVEYDIATGLKGLDRLMQIQILRDAMNMIIQSQQGIAEIDIVKLLNYFMSLAGDRTDLTQFRRAIQPGIPGQPGQPGQPVAPGAAPPGAAPANPQLNTPQVPGGGQ